MYHLNVGAPDIKSPDCAINALIDQCKKMHHLSYTNSAGFIELRRGMVEKYYRKIGIDIDETEILIEVAGSEAYKIIRERVDICSLGALYDYVDEDNVPISLEDLEADLERPEPPAPSPFRCGACHGTTTVGADGVLYPCHRFVGLKAWAVGDIDRGPDLERCRQFWRDYRACIKETCSRCWAYRLCGGPCPWSIARKDGSFALNERACEATRRWIMQGAWYLDLKRKQKKGTNP